MTSFVSSKLYKDGRVLIKDERSESFIKQIVSVNNQYINLKVINSMIEENIYLNIVIKINSKVKFLSNSL